MLHHAPDDTAVLYLGPVKLVLYLNPWGPSRALWFWCGSGALLLEQPVGIA